MNTFEGPDAGARAANAPDWRGTEVRPVVTIHLPLEMGLVGEIMQAVAKAYPGAVVAAGWAEITDGNGRTYSSPAGKATVLLAQVER